MISTTGIKILVKNILCESDNNIDKISTMLEPPTMAMNCIWIDIHGEFHQDMDV